MEGGDTQQRAIVDTFRLLGYEATGPYSDLPLSSPDLLRRPTARAAELSVHFLLSRLDPSRAAVVFKFTFPPRDARSSKEFRQAAFTWLSEIEATGAFPRGTASLAAMSSPTSVKITALLWGLSCHVLRSVAERECGVADVQFGGSGGALLEPLVCARASTFAETVRSFQHERLSWRKAAAILTMRCTELVRYRDHVRAQLDEELSRASDSAPLIPEVADKTPSELVALLQPAWNALADLSSASKRLAAEANGACGEAARGVAIDGESLALGSLPEELKAALASVWDPSLRPLLDGGAVDIVALLQVFSVTLSIIDAKRKSLAGMLVPERIAASSEGFHAVTSTHESNVARLSDLSCALDTELALLLEAVASLESEDSPEERDAVDPLLSVSDVETRSRLNVAAAVDFNFSVALSGVAVELPEPDPEDGTSPAEGMRTPTRGKMRNDVMEKLARSVKRISIKTNTPKAKIVESMLSRTGAPLGMTLSTDRCVRRKLDFSESSSLASTSALNATIASMGTMAASGSGAGQCARLTATATARRQPPTAVGSKRHAMKHGSKLHAHTSTSGNRQAPKKGI